MAIKSKTKTQTNALINNKTESVLQQLKLYKTEYVKTESPRILNPSHFISGLYLFPIFICFLPNMNNQ